MNDYYVYQQAYEEAVNEDYEGLMDYLFVERAQALSTYFEDEEVIFCLICGEPLRKGSVSYFEGYHIDSCL